MSKILEMFKSGKSAYEIHLETGESIKKIYHVIKNDEVSKNAHRKALNEARRDYENYASGRY